MHYQIFWDFKEKFYAFNPNTSASIFSILIDNNVPRGLLSATQLLL